MHQHAQPTHVPTHSLPPECMHARPLASRFMAYIHPHLTIIITLCSSTRDTHESTKISSAHRQLIVNQQPKLGVCPLGASSQVIVSSQGQSKQMSTLLKTPPSGRRCASPLTQKIGCNIKHSTHGSTTFIPDTSCHWGAAVDTARDMPSRAATHAMVSTAEKHTATKHTRTQWHHSCQ